MMRMKMRVTRMRNKSSLHSFKEEKINLKRRKQTRREGRKENRKERRKKEGERRKERRGSDEVK